jgi:hypothetical protein
MNHPNQSHPNQDHPFEDHPFEDHPFEDHPFEEGVPDELTVARLRRALAASAGTVEPSPESWQRLQAAIAADPHHPVRRHRGPRPLLRRWLPVIAAAAAVAVVGGTATMLRLRAGTPLDAAPATLTSYEPTAPAVEPLPVYFVAHLGDRWALVREFHQTDLTDPQERLQAAVDLAVSGKALDGDETSVWRHLGLTGRAIATVDSERIQITLPSSLLTAPRPVSGSSAAGSSAAGSSAAGPAAAGFSTADTGLGTLAIEQLVFTATAATQQTVPVQLVTAGGEKRLLQAPLGTATFSRSSLPARLAPVWVDSLNEGDPLRRGTASIRCQAVATDDGSPTWTLLRQDGGGLRTVATGTAPLADDFGQPIRLGQRGACVVHLPLATTGHYRLEIRNDGWTQTRSFVVR